jgi:hypothetical protein
LQEEGNYRPGGALQAIGLGQQVHELAEAIDQVGGGEYQQGAPALLHRLLESLDARHAQGKRLLGGEAHTGAGESIAQVAFHPLPIGLGVGEEQVILRRPLRRATPTRR